MESDARGNGITSSALRSDGIETLCRRERGGHSHAGRIAGGPEAARVGGVCLYQRIVVASMLRQ